MKHQASILNILATASFVGLGFTVLASLVLRYIYLQIEQPNWLEAAGEISMGILIIAVSLTAISSEVQEHPRSFRLFAMIVFGMFLLLMAVLLLMQGMCKLLPEIGFGLN